VNVIYQYLLIVSTLLVSWFGMMLVHELGHCLHAWLSGGAVAHVALHPLVISRTDCSANPHPLFVAWGGPIWGTLIPLAILVVSRLARSSAWYVFQFFAGFCLVINGLYIFEDSFFRAGDGGDMIRNGTPVWVMLAFGAVAVSLGFYLWDGLGPWFGLGEARGRVNRKVAVYTFCVLVAIVALEVAIGGR
jgi:hypothetical protein